MMHTQARLIRGMQQAAVMNTCTLLGSLLQVLRQNWQLDLNDYHLCPTAFGSIVLVNSILRATLGETSHTIIPGRAPQHPEAEHEMANGIS
jgi:hypothetical protein